MLKGLFERKKQQGTFVEHRLHTKYERRKMTLILLGSFAVTGWVYVLFGSHLFTIQHIRIDGLERLERGEVMAFIDEQIDSQRTWPVRERNIFVIDTEEIICAMEDELFIEKITVDKVYPNILRLNIEERHSSLILFVDESFYEVDHYGIITREIISKEEKESIWQFIYNAPATQKSDTPILKIRGVSKQPVQGQEFVSEFRSRIWLDTFEVLEDLGFGYRNAVIDYATSSKIVLNMFEPYEVYFDMLEPLEPQINGFYAFMKAKDSNTPIREYVDARVLGKVFYK